MMKISLPLRIWIAALLMCGGAALAYVAKPTIKLAETRDQKLTLEQMFPRQFGGWRIDPYGSVVTPSPDVRATIETIYQEVLSRTYINSQGYRVMLSVAYGGDQSEALKVHRPEVCYQAQGFQIDYVRGGGLKVGSLELPVRRVKAHLDPRQEPMSYWIVTGDTAVISPMQQKLVQLSYGLRGLVPDGMLVRVSSIDADELRAYEMQRRFVEDMSRVMTPQQHARVFGLKQAAAQTHSPPVLSEK